MQLRGPSAIINLQPDECLRIESGAAVQVGCLCGVLWITREGDPVDSLVAAGQTMRLAPRGLTLVTALEPALLRVQDPPPKAETHPWMELLGRARKAARSLALY